MERLRRRCAELFAQGDLGWVNEVWDDRLFFLKGVAGIVGVLLLVYHVRQPGVQREWTPAQRGRYWLLMGYALVASVVSWEEIHDGEAIDWPHLLRLILAVVTVAVALMSIREADLKRRERRGRSV